MPNGDFWELSSDLDEVTRWYLSEIVYCLEHYLGLTGTEAYKKVVSSEYLKTVLGDDPLFIQTEDGFYWAMAIMHKNFWWQDENTYRQHKDYVRARHHPPAHAQET